MRRIAVFLMVCFVCVLGMAGCAGEAQYRDGTYMVEFRDFDGYGYKDFMRATVEGGEIVQLEYNATNSDGTLRTEDADYEERMSLVQDTYPARYTGDLVNQYMSSGSIDEVDTVAGATWSSECFRALFEALEVQIQAGDTSVVQVDNVPEV